MASAYSILRNYGDFIQPYDFNLIQKGLEYKQSKFDANSALIQEQINQFANLELAKEEDRQYLNERLNSLVDQINEHGSIDLSSTGITRNLQNHVKQALDENVMNAYAGTQNLKKYQQEVEYYKKNKPEQYSQINEMYGMQGAVAWLNDGQAGTTFQGSSYTPFVDVDTKLDDMIVEMAKNRPESEVSIPTNDGRIVTKKVKELNAEEIRTVASQMLGVEDEQQLAINGWFNFGRVSPSQTLEVFDKYKNERMTMLDGQIAALELKKKQGVDPSVSQELDTQIAFLNTQKNNFEVRTSNVGRNPQSIGTFLEKEKVINGVISKNAFREVDIAYENDVAYWNSVDHQYKQLNDERNYQLKLREQNFKENKFTVEQGLVDPKAPDIQVTSRITDNPSDEIDPEAEIYNTIDTNVSKRTAIIQDFEDKIIGTENAEMFNKAVEAWKKLPENESKTDAEIKTEVALNLSNNGQNTEFMSIEDYTRLRSTDNLIKQSKQTLVTAANKSNKGIEKQADVLYDVAIKNTGITTFDDSKGQPVKKNYAQYFKEKGINSFEDLKRNKVEFDKFMMQTNADFLLTDLGLQYTGGIFGNRSEAGFDSFRKQMSDENFDSERGKMQYYVNQLARISGEEVNLEDVFNIEETRFMSGGDTNRSSTKGVNITLKEQSANAPKTLEFLQKTLLTGSYDTSGGFKDDSFQDDATSRNVVSYDAVKETYQDSLEEEFRKLPQNKTVGLKSKTPLHSEAVSIAETMQGGFKVDDGTDLRVYLNPNDTSTVVIEQVQIAGKSAKDGIAQEDKRVIVPIKDLQGTNLSKVVDFNNQAATITVDNMRPIVKQNINFASDSNIDYYEGLKDYVLGENNPQLGIVTKQGVRNSLYSEYGAFYTDTEGNPTDISKVVNSFIENPSKFELKAKPNGNKSSINLEVSYKNERGGKEVLDVIDLKTKEFDQYQSIYDTAPQIFLYIAMKNILDESVQESILTGGQVENEKIKKLKSLYNVN